MRLERPRAPLVYQLFDLLYLDGRSLLGVPLEDRKRLLRRVVRDTPAVRYLSHVDEDGEDLYARRSRTGSKGIIAKLRDARPTIPASAHGRGSRSRSAANRSWSWSASRPGKGSHAELGALLVATHDDGGFRYAGEVGSGIDTRTRPALRRMRAMSWPATRRR